MIYITTVTNHGGFNRSSTIKVTEDKFVWIIVTELQAECIFASKLFELYILYNDDSESLIETFDEIREANELGLKIAIEAGTL